MISVVIPAYNAERTIGDCLLALLSQNYPKNKYEIIVVDDCSKDETVSVVEKFRKVKLIRQKHSGPAAARNLGVKRAKGDIVLFTDSDCVPDKNWIKNMVKPFEDQQVVGVSGTYRTLNKDRLVARFAGYEIEERHEKLKQKQNIDFIGTFSAGYRKKIFLKFGGFDESFPIASGEVPELSFKINEAGLKMAFQPKAIVYHRHPDTLYKFLKQKFWRGYWRIPLYRKHTGKLFRHSYTPKFLYAEISLLGLACSITFLGLMTMTPIFFGISLFILAFILTLPFSFKIFKKDKATGLLSPLIIILRNFATGMGICYGIANLINRNLIKAK